MPTFDRFQLLPQGLPLRPLSTDLPLEVLGVLLGVEEVFQDGLVPLLVDLVLVPHVLESRVAVF